MNILNWTIRILSGILLLIPMVLAIPGYMLYVLGEEIEDYQDKQKELEEEIKRLNIKSNGEENIL